MENLNWQSHIMLLSNTLSKTYYVIRALKQTVSTYILRNIYFAHFQTEMRYGLVLWGRSRESIEHTKKGDKNDDWFEKGRII